MMDPFVEKIKKQYELRVIEILIGRCYPSSEISNLNKKRMIFEEAEIFYRDHIFGLTGSDATHHNVEQRFPSLNTSIRAELSVFAEKMHSTGDDVEKIEKVMAEYGVTVSFNAERLKAVLKTK